MRTFTNSVTIDRALNWYLCLKSLRQELHDCAIIGAIEKDPYHTTEIIDGEVALSCDGQAFIVTITYDDGAANAANDSIYQQESLHKPQGE
jgi:hypothetical protein